MSESALRFECIMEPDGRWMVWDAKLGLPAQFSVLTLIGLCHREALSLCHLLNATQPTDLRHSQAS